MLRSIHLGQGRSPSRLAHGPLVASQYMHLRRKVGNELSMVSTELRRNYGEMIHDRSFTELNHIEIKVELWRQILTRLIAC